MNRSARFPHSPRDTEGALPRGQPCGCEGVDSSERPTAAGLTPRSDPRERSLRRADNQRVCSKLLLCAALALSWSVLPLTGEAGEVNLVENPGFESVSGQVPRPEGYTLQGSAFWGLLGSSLDIASHGLIFPGKAEFGGGVSQIVKGIDQSKGRWLDFRFRGLAEKGFVVTGRTLKMKMEFFSHGGTNYLDCASRDLDDEILRDRKNLTVNGDYHVNGAAVWRTYELEELLPFKEVDTVKISISYANGAAPVNAQHAAFLVDDLSLVQHPSSTTGKVDPAAARRQPEPKNSLNPADLVSLGGRWYYLPNPDEKIATPLTVKDANADRLFYKTDRYLNPFQYNMTAWMHPGYKDEGGSVITEDTFVPDNVVLDFKGDGYLRITTRNLPNHPTAKFPGLNPSYIQESTRTYYLPLEPKIDPQAKAVDELNKNRALPMGPIGIAVNGVVFFNPFDANMLDASNIMDYCCGHPNQDNLYHYHKYPICVNTPFIDKGDAPSQVIGFAFDGLPIYGPYQSAGVMAKDSTTNPLNAFNACFDEVRGWHYHVTPGKFPYVIGGFFAKVESNNVGHFGPRGGRPGMGGFGGGPGFPGALGQRPPGPPPF